MSSAMQDHNGGTKASGHPLSGGLGVFLFLLLFGAAGFLTYRTLTTAPIPKATGESTMFVCSETNKPFEYTLKEGDTYPVDSPYTKKKTGYPAEACYWTKDGKHKKDPTWVILNSTLGKEGDTKCPDCGRVVVGHNPIPGPDVPMAK